MDINFRFSSYYFQIRLRVATYNSKSKFETKNYLRERVTGGIQYSGLFAHASLILLSGFAKTGSEYNIG